MGNLIGLLEKSFRYRTLYVKYKIIVEHRGLPHKLLQDLPQEISMEMKILYEKEKEKFIKKKTTQISKR